MTIEEQLVKVQTAFQKHLDECSKGFYGRIAARQAVEIKELKRQLADLKQQVSEQWV